MIYFMNYTSTDISMDIKFEDNGGSGLMLGLLVFSKGDFKTWEEQQRKTERLH